MPVLRSVDGLMPLKRLIYRRDAYKPSWYEKQGITHYDIWWFSCCIFVLKKVHRLGWSHENKVITLHFFYGSCSFQPTSRNTQCVVSSPKKCFYRGTYGLSGGHLSTGIITVNIWAVSCPFCNLRRQGIFFSRTILLFNRCQTAETCTK